MGVWAVPVPCHRAGVADIKRLLGAMVSPRQTTQGLLKGLATSDPPSL